MTHRRHLVSVMSFRARAWSGDRGGGTTGSSSSAWCSTPFYIINYEFKPNWWQKRPEMTETFEANSEILVWFMSYLTSLRGGGLSRSPPPGTISWYPSLYTVSKLQPTADWKQALTSLASAEKESWAKCFFPFGFFKFWTSLCWYLSFRSAGRWILLLLGRTSMKPETWCETCLSSMPEYVLATTFLQP